MRVIPKRFEIHAALLLGLMLPALETTRRGFEHWSVNFTTMFEDYVAGASLLTAAAASRAGATWARAWMVVTWSGITFMMLISCVSQMEKQWRGELEAHSATVLVIKLLLLAASGYALRRALQTLQERAAPSIQS